MPLYDLVFQHTLRLSLSGGTVTMVPTLWKNELTPRQHKSRQNLSLQHENEVFSQHQLG